MRSIADAITRDGLFLQSLHFEERIAVAAATTLEAVRDAEIVLVCVKTLDTEEAARSLLPYLTQGAIVVSMQNGVDNVERIHAAAGIKAVPAVVYVSAEMTAPGSVKHNGRGDLSIGDFWGGHPVDQQRQVLEKIAATFVRGGVPCRICDNIRAELWTKLIINCAYNAISAICQARYGRVVQNTWTRDLMIQVVQESLAVAHADGVHFPDADYVEITLNVAKAMPGALSSTGQDLARGKPTEIDSLNGYVVRRGAEVGVATPVNQSLHALVKLLEEQQASSS